MKLGSLLVNYDVKSLSKFGGIRKNRTIATSHPLSVSWGIPICKAGKEGAANKGSLHRSNFRRIKLSVFKYRLTKNGFSGSKRFRGFRETGPSFVFLSSLINDGVVAVHNFNVTSITVRNKSNLKKVDIIYVIDIIWHIP